MVVWCSVSPTHHAETAMIAPYPLFEIRPVEGFPGYFVRNDGQLTCHHNTRRQPCPPRILAGTVTPRGYVRTTLHSGPGENKHKFIHEIVLTAFVGPRPPGMEACHWDGNKQNNALWNLRWDTSKANAADSIRLGRVKNQVGSNNGNAKLDEATVREIKRFLAEGRSYRETIDRFGVTQNMVNQIKNGYRWQHVAA
jgi:hypothetical protein